MNRAGAEEEARWSRDINMHMQMMPIYLSGVRVRHLSVPNSLGTIRTPRPVRANGNAGSVGIRSGTVGIKQSKGPSNFTPIKIEIAADAMAAQILYILDLRPITRHRAKDAPSHRCCRGSYFSINKIIIRVL
jgi:hypothetical protein